MPSLPKIKQIKLPDGNTYDLDSSSTFEGLTDVDINDQTLADGQVPRYNSQTQKWENGDASVVADLDDLGDVEITNVADGDTVMYDSTATKWVNKTTDVTLTQAEYDALVANDEVEAGVDYHISDGILTCVPLDDTDVSQGKTWSSVKINKLNVVTTYEVDLQNWNQDTTSQPGTTLYKKQISLTKKAGITPTVSIGASGALPTVAQQESYNLLQYVTVDNSVPCLYLYSSAIPTTAFYINLTCVSGGVIVTPSLTLSNTNVVAYGEQNKYYGVKRVVIDQAVANNSSGQIQIRNIDNDAMVYGFNSGTFTNIEIDCSNTPNIYFSQSNTGTHTVTLTGLKIYFNFD